MACWKASDQRMQSTVDLCTGSYSYLKTLVRIIPDEHANPFRSTVIGNYSGVLWTEFLGRQFALYSAGRPYTGRLVKMLPIVFLELSGVLFRFSRVEVWLFVHFASSEDMFFSQKSSKIYYFRPTLQTIPIYENRLAAPKSKWDPRETKKCSRKPSENYGIYLQERIGVFGSPVEENRYSWPRIQLREPKLFLPIVGLTSEHLQAKKRRHGICVKKIYSSTRKTLWTHETRLKAPTLLPGALHR